MKQVEMKQADGQAALTFLSVDYQTQEVFTLWFSPKTSFLIQKLPHLPLPCCLQPAFLDIYLTSHSIYLSSFTAVSESLLPSSSASGEL